MAVKEREALAWWNCDSDFEYRSKPQASTIALLFSGPAHKTVEVASPRKYESSDESEGHEITDDEKRFRTNRDRWLNETILVSSMMQKAMHPCYQSILGMGAKALPFIFRDLEQSNNHWFWALAAITGENPVGPGERGNIKMMREAWLNYAKNERLI